MHTEFIAKEELGNCHFTNAASQQEANLAQKLAYGTHLGNAFKGKSIITFNTDSGQRKVETTIWAVTENHIQLKGEALIPINSIISIGFHAS
jgi:hypothetical protein